MRRANWKKTTATVTDCAYIDSMSNAYQRSYAVSYRFSVNGEFYDGRFFTTKVRDTGSTLCLLYDPANPGKSQLSPSIDRFGVKRRVAIAMTILVVALFVGLYLSRRLA